jgi:hypothetical protein
MDNIQWPNEYPYMATWTDSIEMADRINEVGSNGWIHWNGIYGITPPVFVRYQDKTYSFEEFKKEIWNQ